MDIGRPTTFSLVNAKRSLDDRLHASGGLPTRWRELGQAFSY
jgi:hypothetical protein